MPLLILSSREAPVSPGSQHQGQGAPSPGLCGHLLLDAQALTASTQSVVAGGGGTPHYFIPVFWGVFVPLIEIKGVLLESYAGPEIKGG